jgi:hypothetical protein
MLQGLKTVFQHPFRLTFHSGNLVYDFLIEPPARFENEILRGAKPVFILPQLFQHLSLRVSGHGYLR